MAFGQNQITENALVCMHSATEGTSQAKRVAMPAATYATIIGLMCDYRAPFGCMCLVVVGRASASTSSVT